MPWAVQACTAPAERPYLVTRVACLATVVAGEGSCAAWQRPAAQVAPVVADAAAHSGQVGSRVASLAGSFCPAHKTGSLQARPLEP